MKPLYLALLGAVAGAAAAAAVVRPWEDPGARTPPASAGAPAVSGACPVASTAPASSPHGSPHGSDAGSARGTAAATAEGDGSPLHAFARVTDRLYRSAEPDGEAAFRQAAEAGIRTIVSVDGARPDVDLARRFGLRYVHVPIGYDGITPEQAATITKAVTTLEGPFLFHCHHGKHRGPAACALALRAMDGADAEAAVAVMKDAGTGEMYTGLWRDVRGYARPDEAVLAKVPAELPEAVSPMGLRKSMVELDHGWDLVKALRDAGWKPLPEHPDLAPSHQVVILAEGYREILRLEEVAHKPADFRHRLEEAEKAAWDLAGILDEPEPDAAKAKEAFRLVENACSACHRAYRN